MSNDPYAAPTADLQTDSAAIETSIWSARGRLGRLSHLGQVFLLTIIFLVLLGLSAGLLGMGAGGLQGMDPANLDPSMFSSPMAIVGGILLFIVFIVFMYLYICLLIKRLHDRNHSGWWSLPLIVISMIPVIGLISMLGYIYVWFFPGNKHANRFGGQRMTKGWEKVLGILYIVLMAVIFIGGGAAVFMGMAGGV